MFHQQEPLKQLCDALPPSRQLFLCQDCGKQYNTQLGYRRHLVASHSAAGLEESPSLLPEHADRPAPPEGAPVRERKYSCERCDRRFYTRKDVRRHAVVHTGRRDFLCPRCAQRFGRRDHLTRHLKKSHAQESGSPLPPPALHPVKEEPGPATPDMPNVPKEPMEPFSRDMCSSYNNPTMGSSHNLMQGSLTAGMGHHAPPQPSHALHHMQPPAAPQQQPYGNMPRYQHASTSYPRCDVDSFLLDLQSAPPPHLGAVASSPQREALADGEPLSRSPPELSTNVDLGPLLGFLPFGLPPYSPHMGMGGLVMSYPPATSSSGAAPSPAAPAQTPGPFGFFNPPQPPQPPAVQLPQAYGSAPSALPHYYQAFQQ